jgi:hypothetical protein
MQLVQHRQAADAGVEDTRQAACAASCADTPPGLARLLCDSDPRSRRARIRTRPSPSIVSLISSRPVSAIRAPSACPDRDHAGEKRGDQEHKTHVLLVPCPRSLNSAACARPISSYISTSYGASRPGWFRG